MTDHQPVSLEEVKALRDAAQPPPRERPVLRDEAYHGPIGDLVKILKDDTEADPAAVLASLLAAFGVLCGRGPTMWIGLTQHHTNINILIVGDSGEGAKGDSWNIASYLLARVDPDWGSRTISGLNSGEGLIERLGDPPRDPDAPDDVEPEPIDKRKLIVETEFGQQLKRSKGQTNTISSVVRQVFDGHRLESTARRQNQLFAAGYHASIVAHINPSDLSAELEKKEVGNGLVNRFIVVWSERQRWLPFPPDLRYFEWGGPVDRLRAAAAAAQRISPVGSLYDMFTPEARAHYEPIYPYLKTGRRDMADAGAAVGRGAPLVCRLAMLYALADMSYEENRLRITDEHLTAALALWDYAAESAAFVFSAKEFDPMTVRAEKVISFLQEAAPHGVKQVHVGQKVFGNNAKREQMEALRQYMEDRELVDVQTIPTATSGRPPTYWYLRRRSLTPDYPGFAPSPATAGNGSTEHHAEIYPINPAAEAADEGA